MKPTLLLGVIGVAFVGFLGYYRLNGGQQQQVRLTHTQIAQEQDNQHAQADVASLLHQLEGYRKRLPPEPDPSWLVREVVAVGQPLGLQFTTITQGTPQEFSEFTRLTVTLEFTASYHQLGTFLDQVEHATPFLRVDRIDISSATGRDEAVPVHVNLSTFYLPPIRAAGGH